MHAAGKNQREPGRRWDHLLPAMLLVVGGGLLEVWASWLTIASVSGFPRIGRMTTGWILPVTTEAYWTVALFAWLVIPAGPRSRKFAMWSAAGVFALSLTGQESGHLVAAAGGAANAFVVGLVTALPLVAVALGAILIHLRQADWEAADAAEQREAEAERQAEIERAEADDRGALRAEITDLRQRHESDLAAFREAHEDALNVLRAQLAEANDARTEAERVRADAEAQCAKLARKLGANPGTRSARTNRAGRRTTAVPNDVAARAEALRILSERPGISGADLGKECGMSKRWGQLRKQEFASHVPDPVTGPGSGE